MNQVSLQLTLILFTCQAPNPLAETLITLGHQVYEALAISEVIALAEQHPASHIVITSDVDQNRASIIQRHYPTVHLHGQVTAMDVSLN
jgi:ABC-type nitrate/sulfonate/bicarbonate transport system ATPase subunit